MCWCTRQLIGVGWGHNNSHSVVATIAQTSEDVVVGISTGNVYSLAGGSTVGDCEPMSLSEVGRVDPVSLY